MAAGRIDEREKALKDLLRERLKNSDSGVAFISLKELQNTPLLSDKLAVESSIKKICDESKGAITYKERKGDPVYVASKHDEVSTQNIRRGQEGPPLLLPPQVIGYEVFVSDSEKLEGPAASEVDALRFDPSKSRLYVRGTEIKIRKFSDQYHVLRIIFEKPEDIKQEWFFSELKERIDPHQTKEKRYYNAVHQVRLKLATFGFSDFFTTTNQSVKISSEYLS